MEDHELTITIEPNGVMVAQCKCGAYIYTKTPNRRRKTMSEETFTAHSKEQYNLHLEFVQRIRNMRRVAKILAQDNNY